jgi:hypothetical protein
MERYLQKMIETMQGTQTDPLGIAQEAAGQQTEYASSPEGRSLGYLCRIARRASEDDHLAYTPPDDVHHQRIAGVILEDSMRTPELTITNPAAYITALQGLKQPEDPTEQQFQLQMLTHANSGAAGTLAHLHLEQNAQIIEDMYRGIIPEGSGLNYLYRGQNTEADASQQAILTQLPGMAAKIARESERLGLPAVSVHAYDILATAHAEGMLVEFAAAYDLHVITDINNDIIGVDRLCDPTGWNAVYAYLQHLSSVAPNAEFTRKIRDALLQDINDLLGDDEADRSEQEAEEVATGMLHQARLLINHLLPKANE